MLPNCDSESFIATKFRSWLIIVTNSFFLFYDGQLFRLTQFQYYFATEFNFCVFFFKVRLAIILLPNFKLPSWISCFSDEVLIVNDSLLPNGDSQSFFATKFRSYIIIFAFRLFCIVIVNCFDLFILMFFCYQIHIFYFFATKFRSAIVLLSKLFIINFCLLPNCDSRSFFATKFKLCIIIFANRFFLFANRQFGQLTQLFR